MLVAVLSASCAGDQRVAESTAAGPAATNDAQHPDVTGPHGDHTAHHGGLVLMNGDVHYEVVLSASGRLQVWFSDSMRNELPASVASGVTIEVLRPGAASEMVALAIDEAGEAWIATARPLAGDGISVKVRYRLQGEPHEIEIPFSASAQ
ncbi:MAG: hypothetical protein RLZZ53_3151 [Acidobacteriota bacterium]|jgi:hypothetical protein